MVRINLAQTTLIACCAALLASPSHAQQIPSDAAIDTIRGLGNIGASDQRQIRAWVSGQVGRLAREPDENTWEAFRTYRTLFQSQRSNASNSDAFNAQLAAQFADVAKDEFAKPALKPEAARVLARILVDFGGIDSLPAALAGLKTKDESARFYCAKVIVSLKSAIAVDKDTVTLVVASLNEAGLIESSSVVLRQIYLGLALPSPQTGSVIDAYLAIFDRQLEMRRGSVIVVEPAEIDAFEYFRVAAVFGALNASQKAKLVHAVATFLRLDAERYQSADLSPEEIAIIEHRLDGAEGVLVLAQSTGGGYVRREMSSGGHATRASVLQQTFLWVGDPNSKTPGALSKAPWNVPVGAP